MSPSVSRPVDTGATITPSILGFNRAFVQWAGITAGITQSFYDFYSGAATGYRAYLPNEDTGDAGWWVWAYTAQLGNGLSASISAEERRTSQIINVTSGTLIGLTVNTTAFTTGLATLFGAAAPNSQRHHHRSGHQYRWLRRHPVAGYRRQYSPRPDLGQRPDHGRGA